VLTAIVPVERKAGKPLRLAPVEDGLEVEDVVVEVFVVVGHPVEERGGRQLLLVAGDDELGTAVQTTDRICFPHLGGLVEDDHVETEPGREEL
jgi:hypothetical protein